VIALKQFWAAYKNAWHLALEYRIAIIIWMFSMVIPLVMLAGWLSLAEDGPVGRFGRIEFIQYYLAAILVRNLSGVWIIWELDADIRKGEMSFKLLKPMDPMIYYVAHSLSAKPLRLAMLVPIIATVMWFVPGVGFNLSPLNLLFFAAAVLGTWAILFVIQYANGLLSFWITQSLGINDMWFGVFAIFSGYLIPYDLFPPLLRDVLYALPFRYMMSFPIEIITGQLNFPAMLRGLALEWMWVAIFFAGCRLLWRRGIRQYSAVGA
jgi:ABC-2 type transport system permease protein